MPEQPHAANPPRHVLLSSMKDEGPFVLEFVAHHRVLGFDAIHIASNDCSDGTDLLLDALAAEGFVTHTRNHVPDGQVAQHLAYRRMRNRQDVDSADWIMVLDVDEFLIVDRGARRVGDLTALAGPEVELITLNPMNFGTSANPDWQPGRVAQQFTQRLPEDHPRNNPVKSLVRGGGRWRALGNHHPSGFEGAADIRFMRGNGAVNTVPNDGRPWDHLRNFPAEWITHAVGWHNHYPIKSIDSFMMRRARGRGAVARGKTRIYDRHNERYWQTFAAGRTEDRRILDFYGADTEAEMARMLALPAIAAAHAEAQRRYGAMIATIAHSAED